MGSQVILKYHYSFAPGVGGPVGRMHRAVITDGGIEEAPVWYKFDDRSVATIGRVLTPELADLVDIGGAIRFADSLSPRPSVAGSWRRDLTVEIPVRQSRLWFCTDLEDALASLLSYLTGDLWLIRFIPRSIGPRVTEMRLPLQLMPNLSSAPVVLHSGGMDSFMGLVRAGKCSHFVVGASVVTHARHRHLQRQQLRGLQETLRTDFLRVSLDIGHVGVPRSDRDDTQRARSVLHLAFAAAVAILTGTGQVSAFENGIGAINLPVSNDQVSAQMTRAVNPVTLDEASRLFSIIADDEVSFFNPGLRYTKGELAQRIIHTDALYDLALKTVSCDHFPRHAAACGSCTSCLLREAALFALGAQHQPQCTASLDFIPTIVSRLNRGDSIDWLPFLSMDHQVSRMQAALRDEAPGISLIEAFPDLYQFVGLQGLGIPEMVRMYTEYVVEWSHFRDAISNTAGANLSLFPSPMHVRKPA